jgi:SAM-dependent methyltransferase
MKKSLLQYLACPACKGSLTLSKKGVVWEESEIKEGSLTCRKGHTYEIRNFIARFVHSDAYVDSFSFEWTHHSQTQIDNGELAFSEESFKTLTHWTPEQLRGTLVLDVGCGVGRYADVAERMGGTVIGVDLSYAIDAAYANIGRRENVHLVQADIFRLPFKKNIFDRIYSLGVLHHSQNTQEAFAKLPPLLKKNGVIAIWVYAQYRGQSLHDFIRINITSKLPRKALHYICLVLSSAPIYYLYRIPGLRLLLQTLFWYPADGEAYKRWRFRWLDLFDFYSPTYAFRHTYPETWKWFKTAGLSDIQLMETPVAISGKKI